MKQEIINKLEIIKSSTNSDYVKNALIEAIQALSQRENSSYIEWLERKIEQTLEGKDLQREHWAFCKALNMYREYSKTN